MHFPRRNATKSVLCIVVPLLFARLALPCVPDGGSTTITLPRPSLPADLPGAPSGNFWAGTSPGAEEHDDTSPNDAMGKATPDATGNSASVDVTNTGGNLKGPNGTVQNGGSEGDCIEVRICWSYWTWAQRPFIRFTHTGFESGWYWVRVKRQKCNPRRGVEVCPCP